MAGLTDWKWLYPGRRHLELQRGIARLEDELRQLKQQQAQMVENFEARLVTALRQESARLTSAIEESADRVMGSIETSSARLTKSVDASAKGLAGAFDKAAAHISGSFDQSFARLSESFDKSAMNMTGRFDRSFVRMIESSNQSTAEMTGALDRSSSRLTDLLNQSATQMTGAFDQSFDRLGRAFDQSTAQLTVIFDHSFARLEGSIDQSATHLTGAFDQSFARLEGDIDQAAKHLAGAFDHSVARFGGTLDQSFAGLAGSFDQSAAQLMGAFDASAGRLTGSIDQSAAHVTDALDRSNARIDDTLKQSVERLDRQDDGRLAAGFALATARFAPIDRGHQYYHGLKAVGVLNYEDEWVSGERRFLSLFLSHHPKAMVFDVGANTGRYAQIARELGPDAEIHCFEPHPVSFAKLAQRAPDIGAHTHQLALGSKTGKLKLFDYADEPGSEHASVYKAVIEDVHRRPSAVHSVRSDTVDAVTARLGVDHVALLKIDTEGHELAVLKGASALLARQAIDFIQFEFNEMNVVSRVFMKDFFSILPGYKFYRLLPDSTIHLGTYDPVFMEVFAYQNIVCVRDEIDTSWLTAQDAFPPR